MIKGVGDEVAKQGDVVRGENNKNTGWAQPVFNGVYM